MSKSHHSLLIPWPSLCTLVNHVFGSQTQTCPFQRILFTNDKALVYCALKPGKMDETPPFWFCYVSAQLGGGLEEKPGNQGVFWNIAPNQSILIVSEWFAIPYMWVSMSVWSEPDTQPRVGDMHALCPLLQPFHMGSLAAGHIQEERDWTSRCYFASKPTLHNSNLQTVVEVMPFPLRMAQSHSAVFWLNVLVLLALGRA